MPIMKIQEFEEDFARSALLSYKIKYNKFIYEVVNVYTIMILWRI